MTRKRCTLVGAAIGLALFLAVALLPTLYYGGFAGVLLASGLAGAPVRATFLVRALVVLGMALGIGGVAAVFTTAGAAAGAAVAVLTGVPAAPAERDETPR